MSKGLILTGAIGAASFAVLAPGWAAEPPKLPPTTPAPAGAPSATITFHKGYQGRDGIYAQSPYRVVPGRDCKKPLWSGVLLWATSNARKGIVPAGGPVTLAAELTWNGGTAYHTCFASAIFSPEAGHDYDATLKGDGRVVCEFEVTDRATSAPPPDLDVSMKTNCETHGRPSPPGKEPSVRPGWIW